MAARGGGAWSGSSNGKRPDDSAPSTLRRVAPLRSRLQRGRRWLAAALVVALLAAGTTLASSDAQGAGAPSNSNNNGNKLYHTASETLHWFSHKAAARPDVMR